MFETAYHSNLIKIIQISELFLGIVPREPNELLKVVAWIAANLWFCVFDVNPSLVHSKPFVMASPLS